MAVTIVKTTVPTTVTSIQTPTIDGFNALMTAATGDHSIYRDALDKIEAITLEATAVPDAQFSASERAKLIAEMTSSIVASVTNQAMQVALTIAKEDRDAQYTYASMIADAQAKDANAEATIKEAENKAAQNYKTMMDAYLTQTKMRAEYGVTNATLSTDPLTATDIAWSVENGKIGYDMGVQYAQIDSMLAKTYREAGAGTLTFTSTNNQWDWAPTVSNATTHDTALAAGLIHQQNLSQWRQYDAFDDNAKQHVLNSSSNMVGMMLNDSQFTEVLPTLNLWTSAALDLLKESKPELLVGTYDVSTDPGETAPAITASYGFKIQPTRTTTPS